jgi:SAM-dependent methyltransferase
VSTHSERSAQDAAKNPPAAGYITEIPYPIVYHRDLNPSLSTLALNHRGFSGPARGGAYSCVELGSAWGLSSLIHAAGNPAGHFIAVDFNADCIAAGRSIAADADLKNVEFVQADFATFATQPMPAFDMIFAHGVWTWVNDATRSQIIDVVSRHLKPGGLFYVSYNALPGNALAQSLRRLMRVGFNAATGPLSAKVEAGVTTAANVKTAGSAFFGNNPAIAQTFDHVIKTAPRDYLSHEYFNPDWHPFHHAEVAEALKRADLDFACSAHIIDHLDGVQLSPAARAQLAGATDVVARETLHDFFFNALFRRDLFTRGSSVAHPMRDQLMATRFVAGASVESFPRLVAHTMLGEIRPPAESGRAVLGALAAGPASATGLAQHAACAKFSPEHVLEALAFLAALGAIEPALPSEGEATRRDATARLNAAIAMRSMTGHAIDALASPITGGGVMVSRFDQAFLLAAKRGIDPIAFAATMKNAAQDAQIRQAYDRFERYTSPFLARLGIV